jgi:hypothetical protein
MSDQETPEHRYRRALQILSWGPEAMARAAGIQVRKARMWGDGEGVCPEPLLQWLEMLAAFHKAHPPPPPPPFVRKG